MKKHPLLKKIIFVAVFVIALILVMITIPPATKHKPVLRWGADSGSGAPFVFRDPANPQEIVGFDVDVMNAVAAELGMKAEFVQNLWEGLVPGLIAKNYDIIANGFEIKPEYTTNVAFSTPYYVTFEQIVVTKENNTIHSVSDLQGHTVGTLPATSAARILKQIPSVKIKYYPEESNAFNDLALGERLDAVFIDAPIAKYYGAPNPALKTLKDTVGEIKYGLAIRKNDLQLQEQINVALQKLIETGKLRSIIEKWGLWNAQTAKAWGKTEAPLSEPKAYLNYLKYTHLQTNIKDRVMQYLDFIPLLGKGAIVTIEISLLSMAFAVIFGLWIALTRLYAPKFISMLAVTYIEIIRGTPLLIQLYLIFYGLPLIGIKFSPFASAVLGIGLNYAANEAENYRAGVLSVPKSQMDAALALGMSRFQALRYVVLPQAMRLVIPPITNDFIALIKDSSIVSVITLVELTTVYNQLATTYSDYLGIGILVATMYFLIGLPFSYLARRAEKRFGGTKRTK